MLLSHDQAIIDVKNKKACMLVVRTANESKEARFVRALHQADCVKVRGDFVVESSATLLCAVVCLSQNSDVAGVRISVGDDDKHEVSEVAVQICVGEIRLIYLVITFRSDRQMKPNHGL